jgi:hypothetical protein
MIILVDLKILLFRDILNFSKKTWRRAVFKTAHRQVLKNNL